MVTIINKEPHKSVVKETVCYTCGCTLQFVPLDIKEDLVADYLGFRDRYKYIMCPNCHHRVQI